MQAHILNDPRKFDTCKHRSKEQVSKLIKRCSCQGGNYEAKGFMCYKKNIFKVSPGFCEACNEYEVK
jgi:hypothetical protein